MTKELEYIPNIVSVVINTESGCDPHIGEYGLSITSFIGGLNINDVGGIDDISLIKEAVYEFDFDLLPQEGSTEIVLEESGEREDNFWHKYYIIKSYRVIDLNP